MKLRIDKQTHSEMQDRAQRLDTTIAEVARRAVLHLERRGLCVEKHKTERIATRNGSTVITVADELGKFSPSELRQMIQIALRDTRPKRDPFRTSLVPGRDYVIESAE